MATNDERVNLETGQVSKKGVRTKVLESKAWTATPNWFELFFRSAPAPCTHLLWYILRKTVGYSSGTETVETSLADLAYETQLSRTTLSRWATTLDQLCFIRYRPARNGAKNSIIEPFPKGVPTVWQVEVAISGICAALREEGRIRQMRSNYSMPAAEFATRAYMNAIAYRRRALKTPEEQKEFDQRITSIGFVW
jgi:hypothetical protein